MALHTDLPPPPAWPPAPAPPPVLAPGRTEWVIRVLGVVIAALLAVSAVAVVTHQGRTTIDHPEAWDPRVAELAAYAESVRGLEFDHPVLVDFLTAAEYTKETTQDEDGLDEDSRVGLDRQAASLRAIGVASGEVDLFTAFNTVADGGTLAFYDPVEQVVRVRGTEMTVGLQVTLVHELTHALQDQHFDLEQLYEDDLDSSASTAFRALIEGDALRVEDAYATEELSTEEQATYDDEYAAAVEVSAASTVEVPPFISASFSVPYLLGQPFVTMLANQGGNAAVDDAFHDPPFTEEHLFDPASYLGGESSDEVALDLDDDIEVQEEGPFGSPSWYLMLAERIDPKVAFDAALGWAGDAYAIFKANGRTCVRAVFTGDRSSDEKEMASALRAWASEMPGGRAEVIDVDGHPGLHACDPGTDVDMALSGRAEDALYVPSLWSYLVADAATELDEDGSRCYAHGVIDTLTYEQMTDPTGAAYDGDEFQSTLNRAFEDCIPAR